MLADDAPVAEDAAQGWRLDIAAHLPAKRAAIAEHASQHGTVVTDDPEGFCLPERLLRIADERWETFLVP